MKDKKHDGEEENEFWEEGVFVETLSLEEVESRRKTINKGHDEDMNYECRKCGKKISAHNKDWHVGLCDDCFNEQYFSGSNKLIK